LIPNLLGMPMTKPLKSPKRKQPRGVETWPMMQLILTMSELESKGNKGSSLQLAIQAEMDKRDGYDPDKPHQTVYTSREALEEWEKSPEGIFELAARERRKQEYAAYRASIV